MEVGTNFFNLAIFKVRSGGKALVDALLVVVKTRKLSEILCKEICQESPAMKYINTHIEYAKSKGGRSVKACLQHTIFVFFSSCKNNDPVELEVIIDPEFLRSLLLNKCSPR